MLTMIVIWIVDDTGTLKTYQLHQTNGLQIGKVMNLKGNHVRSLHNTRRRENDVELGKERYERGSVP